MTCWKNVPIQSPKIQQRELSTVRQNLGSQVRQVQQTLNASTAAWQASTASADLRYQQELRDAMSRADAQSREREQRIAEQARQQREAMQAEWAAEQARLTGRARELESRQQRMQAEHRQEQERLRAEHRADAQRLEAEQRRLAAEQRRQERELRAEMDQVRREAINLIQEQGRRLSRAIEQERQQREVVVKQLQQEIARESQERERQLRDVQAQLDTVEQNSKERDRLLQAQIDLERQIRERQEEMAQSWLQQADALSASIQQRHTRHEEFAPGQLRKLQRDLEEARQLERAAPQAAIAQAQQVYLALSDLQFTLEQRESEWASLRQQALAAAQEVATLIKENAHCVALDEQGQELEGTDGQPIDLPVDHWTAGKLNALSTRVNELLTELERDATRAGQPLPSVEKLRGMLGDLPQLEARLTALVIEARVAFLASEHRAHYLDWALQALEAQGFGAAQIAWEGNDERAGAWAKVRNRQDAEVVVLVTDEVQIHSYDEQLRSAEELQLRAEEVAKALQAHGLVVGTPRTEGHADRGIVERSQVEARKPRPIPVSAAIPAQDVQRQHK